MTQSIDNFFKDYATSFAKGHIPSIVGAYSFPTRFYTSTGMAIIANEPDFYKNCEKLVELYDQLGMKNPTPEIISTTQLNPSIDLVEIKWNFLREDKKTFSFTTKYIIGKSDGTPKILGVFEVDEHDKISELETAGKV